jgi:type II secretory pathway pseudopilin PulG
MYKKYQNKKNQLGVSLTELVIVLALIGIATPMVVYQLSLYASRLSSQQYADRTVAYSKAFMRYIYNYRDAQGNSRCNAAATATNPDTIKIEDLNVSQVGGGSYLPLGVPVDSDVNPRVGCYRDGHNAIQAVMYYVGENNASDPKYLKQTMFGYNAAQAIGAAAGVYNPGVADPAFRDTIYGIGGGWKLPKNNAIFGNEGRLNTKIIPNSTIVNLTLLPEYTTMQVNSVSVSSNNNNNKNSNQDNNQLKQPVSYRLFSNNSNLVATDNSGLASASITPVAIHNVKAASNLGSSGSGEDNYLYRVEDLDTTHKPGDLAHQNTMQTDITVANKTKDPKDTKIVYHGIRFTTDPNGPMLKSALPDGQGGESIDVTNMNKVVLNGSLKIIKQAGRADQIANIEADGDVSAKGSVTADGAVVGDSLRATGEVDLASKCSDDELGKIKHSSAYIVSSGTGKVELPPFVKGVLLVCRKNLYPIYPLGFNNNTPTSPKVCDAGNCYLPVSPLKVTYFSNGSRLKTFQCGSSELNTTKYYFSAFSYIDVASWSANDVSASANYKYGLDEPPISSDDEFSYKAYHGIIADGEKGLPIIQVTCTIEPSSFGKYFR